VHYRLRGELPAIARQLYRYGRSHPKLYRDFADRGMPPSHLGDVAAAWWRLLVRLPDLVGPPERRAPVLGQLAMRAGRVVGSARYRRCYL
jgi:hypothetical protein